MSLETPVGIDALRAWAEINLAALVENARACARIAGNGSRLLAVVKADGYGHGIAKVAAALAPLPEVWGFGVANVAEAQAVAVAIDGRQKVLILGPVLPRERETVVAAGFSVEVSDQAEAAAWEEVSRAMQRRVAVHITVDTGMGRMGVLPENFPALVKIVLASGQLDLEGVTTHFPSADENAAFTDKQIAEFHQLVESIDPPLPPVLVHAANSAGVMAFSETLGFTNLVRPGLALFGVAPVAQHAGELTPTLSLKSRITLVRDLPAGHGISYGRTFFTDRPTTVATIGIGYADGYPRSLSGNGADVLIAGQRCPLLGRVTMDQIMIDVTDLPQRPQPGDEVVLIGEEISATEVAEKAGTISWEILTGITKRVVRLYRGASTDDACGKSPT